MNFSITLYLTVFTPPSHYRQDSQPAIAYNSIKINLRTYNNILRKSIHNAKATYYRSCFNTFKNNMKKKTGKPLNRY